MDALGAERLSCLSGGGEGTSEKVGLARFRETCRIHRLAFKCVLSLTEVGAGLVGAL